MAEVYVGIDPDLVKNGFAIWYKADKRLEVQVSTFYQIVRYLQGLQMAGIGNALEVLIEAGWLNTRANFHDRAGQSKRVGERIAKNVGENHAVGKLLAQVCDELGIKYRLVRPKTAKVNKKYFEQLTGLQGVKSQEMIDAGMLVYGM